MQFPVCSLEVPVKNNMKDNSLTLAHPCREAAPSSASPMVHAGGFLMLKQIIWAWGSKCPFYRDAFLVVMFWHAGRLCVSFRVMHSDGFDMMRCTVFAVALH